MTQQTFKRKQAVILPQLKLQDDVPVHVQIVSPIYLGKEIKESNGETSQADLMRVVDMTTGEECQMIVGTILKASLEESFPESGYVDKCFEITRHAKAEGKRYKTYALYEIEADEAA